MRRVLAVLSGVAVIAGGVFLSGSSNAQTIEIGELETGQVVLDTSRNSGTLTFDVGSVSESQSITPGCQADGSGSVVADGPVLVEAKGGPLCFGNAGFGVNPGGSPRALDPDIKPGEAESDAESVTLGLGDEYLFTGASIDVEHKATTAEVDLTITGFDEAGQELFTQEEDLADTNQRRQTRVVIEGVPAFKSLTLKFVQGRGQIEGDTGIGTALDVVRATDSVDCGSGGTIETDSGSTGVDISPVCDEGQKSKEFFLDFDEDSNTLSLLYGASNVCLQDDRCTQAVIHQDWGSEDLAGETIYRGTLVQLIDEGPFEPIIRCTDDPGLPPYTNVLPRDLITETSSAVDGVCIFKTEAHAVAGKVVTVEKYFVRGDPRFR